MKSEKIKKLLNKNGKSFQSVIAVEECGELTQAISKCLRAGELVPIHTRLNLIEEMADVMICIEQLQEMYNITDEELFSMKQDKEKRLIERENL